MADKEKSFCAIGNFPYKALNNKKLLEMSKEGKFFPIHAIIIPTNKCNIHCRFCCCNDREKTEELPLPIIDAILCELEKCGTRAITISGGGEPTIHPHFSDIIEHARMKKMGIGLVTNGTNMSKLAGLSMNSFVWCRISFGDGRSHEEVYEIINQATRLVKEGIIGLLGISYVITSRCDEELIFKLARWVEQSEIEYLKFIVDETDCENHDYPDIVKNLECKKKILTPMVHEEMQSIECMLNLIKPIFAADGYVYPCCEIQYNNENSTLCYAKDRRICTYREYFDELYMQEGYKTMYCKKCFHGTLVKFLNSTQRNYIHEDWI